MAECAAVSEILDSKGVSGYKRIITRLLQLQTTIKDSSLTFNDLEDEHTLISLWFQRQVTENRKGRLN